MHEAKEKGAMKNSINWFEIPVSNILRAIHFYASVLSVKIERQDMGTYKMGILAGGGDEQECSEHGALVEGEGYVPSENGTVIYLNANPDLSEALARVENAGGKVLQPKFAIGQYGFIAFFKDTEGNKVALHSVS